MSERINWSVNSGSKLKVQAVDLKLCYSKQHRHMYADDLQEAQPLNKDFLNSVTNIKIQIETQSVDSFTSLRTITQHNTKFHLTYGMSEEIHNAILQTRPNKSGGQDNIAPRVLSTFSGTW